MNYSFIWCRAFFFMRKSGAIRQSCCFTTPRLYEITYQMLRNLSEQNFSKLFHCGKCWEIFFVRNCILNEWASSFWFFILLFYQTGVKMAKVPSHNGHNNGFYHLLRNLNHIIKQFHFLNKYLYSKLENVQQMMLWICTYYRKENRAKSLLWDFCSLKVLHISSRI